MQETILRLPDVLKQTGLSRTALYDLMKWKQFPASMKITKKCCGWLQSEVQEWIKHRSDDR